MILKTLSAALILTSGTLSFFSQEKMSLSGFHITIKSNNNNDIFINNTWNKINDTYQDFVVNKGNKNLLTFNFNSWSEIIDQKPNNKINQTIYNDFKKQVDQEKSLAVLKNNENKLFKNPAISRSVANINFDLNLANKTFGSLYLPYQDFLDTKIKNGIFASISPQCNFNNYFSVPYAIAPSNDFLQQPIAQRIATIAINNNRNFLNERQVVLLAKKPNERLLINGLSNNIINNKNLAYVLLNHNIDDKEKDSIYKITVKNTDTSEILYEETIKLTNTTSKIQFNDSDNSRTLQHDYLVCNNSQNSNLIVMNQAKAKATVNLFGSKSWKAYSVDPKTLAINFNSGSTVDPTIPFGIDSRSDNYQVYYLEEALQPNKKSNNTGQYLVIYRTKCPKFKNWSNLTDNINTALFKGFSQYLDAISTNMSINNLAKNASQFINFFIDYQTDLKNHNFVNYFGNDKNQPWDLSTQFHEITLVDNWKIIIVSILMLLFLILIIPIVIFLVNREKKVK